LPTTASNRQAGPDAALWLAAGLHAAVIAGVFAYALLAPKPKPVVAVFELVSTDERAKLRPLAPKAPEPPAEKPAETRPPEAPAVTPKPTPAPAKPEPKTTQTTPNPSLPVKDTPPTNAEFTTTLVANIPSDPRLAFWAGRVKKLVESRWNPPTGIDVSGTAKTVISFQVERSGKIVEVDVMQSSGNTLLDDLAKRTILRLEKVPMIPENFPGDLLKVSYEFIYNGD
jgi:TonB family protein